MQQNSKRESQEEEIDSLQLTLNSSFLQLPYQNYWYCWSPTKWGIKNSPLSSSDFLDLSSSSFTQSYTTFSERTEQRIKSLPADASDTRIFFLLFLLQSGMFWSLYIYINTHHYPISTTSVFSKPCSSDLPYLI